MYKVFLKLDSSRFPLQSFGDTFYRVYGAKSRHFINIMQALQQFMVFLYSKRLEFIAVLIRLSIIDSCRVDSWMWHDSCSISQGEGVLYRLLAYFHYLRHHRRKHSKPATYWLVCQRVCVDECHLFHYHVSVQVELLRHNLVQNTNRAQNGCCWQG